MGEDLLGLAGKAGKGFADGLLGGVGTAGEALGKSDLNPITAVGVTPERPECD